MSNQGYGGQQFPSFAEDQQPPEQTPVATVPSEKKPTSGWDPLVAAIHSVGRSGKPLLLTLTAENMESPVWIDFYTQRYYSEVPLTRLPLHPEGSKIFGSPIDPQEPPFPWVRWRSMDALFWGVGSLAFATKRAPWLILGERYSLNQWPNLTEIPYSGDDLRAVSMLANGMLTIDELALVSQITPEHSQKLVSILSFMGVLRGTAPRIPAKVVEAMRENVLGAIQSLEELEQASIEAIHANQEEQEAPISEIPVLEIESTEEILVETPDAPDDVAHLKRQLERPSISSIQLPDLPEELFNHASAETATESDSPEETEDLEPPAELYDEPLEETPEDAQENESKDARSYERFAGMPSFETILAQQSALKEAAEGSNKEETKEEKPTGLFGMLKKKLGLK